MTVPLVDWRFQLVSVPDMTVIEDVTHGLSKHLSVVLNRPGACTFRLPITDPVAPLIIPRTTGVIAVKNAADVWGGYVNTRQADDLEGYVNFGAVGWFEDLFKRQVRIKDDRSTETDAVRGLHLLDTVNAQTSNTSAPQPSLVVTGSSFGSFQSRGPHTYEVGTDFGPELQALSDLEAGFDIRVGPRSRVMDIRAWNIYTTTAVRYGYRWGPQNVAHATWDEDASRMCNRMNVVGKNGVRVMYEDEVAIDDFNGAVAEETVTLSDVADPIILMAYAIAEVSIRSRPWRNYQLVPRPFDGSDDVPSIFEDFDLGDKVHYDHRDPLLSVEDQGVRIFGADIDVTDEGHEVISQLQITNQGGGQ
jgi:hypothetical protein